MGESMMEQWVENLFTKEVLKEAATRFGADASDAKKLGDFENYVYEVKRDGKPYISETDTLLASLKIGSRRRINMD